jgi:hypothetical protein
LFVGSSVNYLKDQVKEVIRMKRSDVRNYLAENGLSIKVVKEYREKFFTLLTGELYFKETGKSVAYAEAISRLSGLDQADSNIGYKVALSRLEKALVKKHLGHGRSLHHPLYA